MRLEQKISDGLIVETGRSDEMVDLPSPLGKKKMYTVNVIKIIYGNGEEGNKVAGAAFGKGFSIKEAWSIALKYLGHEAE